MTTTTLMLDRSGVVSTPHLFWERTLRVKPWECAVQISEHGARHICRKRIRVPLFWGLRGSICSDHMHQINRLPNRS